MMWKNGTFVGKNDSAAALSTVECFNPLSGEVTKGNG